MAGQVKVAVVSGAISSSGTGTADFTKAGFGTPKACIVLLSFDTADDASVAIEGRASVGFSDFTNHRCITHEDDDATSKVSCAARKSPTKAYVLLNLSAAVDIDGTASAITDGVRLTNTVNGSASAVFATVIMFGGADLQVSIDSLTLNRTVDASTVVTTGIPQDLVFFIGTDIAGEDSGSTGINNAFGVVDISNDQATIVNRCMGWTSDHNNSFGAPHSIIRNNRCLKVLAESGADDWGIEVTAATVTSYTVTTRETDPGAGMEVYALALDLDDRGSKVGSVDSPTSGAAWTPSVALGFTPQYVGLGLTHLPNENTIDSGADAGGHGISSNTGTGEESFHGWYNEDASADTNTNNIFRSRAIDFRNDDTTVVVQDHSHSSFNSGDWTYTINAENETTAKKWFYWAIEEAAIAEPAVPAKGTASSTGKATIGVRRAIASVGVASAIGLSSIGAVTQTGTLIAGSLTKFSITGDEVWHGKSHAAVWWNSYQNRWDGVIPQDEGVPIATGDHWLTKDVNGTPDYIIELDDRDSGRGSVFWDDAGKRLYYVSFHDTTTEYWEIDYNSGTDTYSFSVGSAGAGETVTGISRETGGAVNTGSIYKYPNSDVWVAYLNNDGLVLNRRTGGVWNGSVVNLDSALNQGVVTLNKFVDGGVTNVFVFSCEDGLEVAAEWNAYFIDQNHASPFTASNWTEDTIDSETEFSTGSDNHVDSVRDNATESIYIVLKTGDPVADVETSIGVLKRTASGTYTSHEVVQLSSTADELRTRPCIALDKANSKLYVAIAEEDPAGDRDCWYHTADLSDLDTWSAETLLFSVSTRDFNQIHSPQQDFNADGTTNLLFVAAQDAVANSNDDDVYHSLVTIPPGAIAVGGKAGGGSTGKATIGVRRAIAAVGVAAAIGTASVGTLRSIAARGVGASTGHVNVSPKRPFAAIGAASSTGHVQIDVSRGLLTRASGSATGTASIKMLRAIAGTGTAGATGHALVNIVAGGVATIAGGASGSSAGLAALEVRRAIAGVASGSSVGKVAIGVLRSIASTGVASSTGKATLQIGGIRAILGRASGVATGKVQLEVLRALASTGTASSTGKATIFVGGVASIAATGTAGSTGTAALGVRRALAARSAGWATGKVNVSPKLVVAARGTAASVGKALVEIRRDLAGTAAGSSVGKVSVEVRRELAARAPGSSTGHVSISFKLQIAATGVASSTGHAKVTVPPAVQFDLMVWVGLRLTGATFTGVRLTGATFSDVQLKE